MSEPEVTKKEKLIAKLKECAKNHDDYEDAHVTADEALLEYIDDDDISAAFNPEGLWWYA